MKQIIDEGRFSMDLLLNLEFPLQRLFYRFSFLSYKNSCYGSSKRTGELVLLSTEGGK
jgi:hypothetical protein